MSEAYRRLGLPVEFIAVKNAGHDSQHIGDAPDFTFSGDYPSENHCLFQALPGFCSLYASQTLEGQLEHGSSRNTVGVLIF
jgi:hypothetical protein